METYVSPIGVGSNELESSNGGSTRGIPVVVFILVAAVTVFAGAFIVSAGVGWNVAVGMNYVVDTWS